MFAVDLISHLSVVCAMPNSLSIARYRTGKMATISTSPRLALNCVWTLLGVLAARERETLLRPTLPALVRICRAFPPLIEDTVQLLTQACVLCSIYHYISDPGMNTIQYISLH